MLVYVASLDLLAAPSCVALHTLLGRFSQLLRVGLLAPTLHGAIVDGWCGLWEQEKPTCVVMVVSSPSSPVCHVLPISKGPRVPSMGPQIEQNDLFMCRRCVLPWVRTGDGCTPLGTSFSGSHWGVPCAISSCLDLLSSTALLGLGRGAGTEPNAYPDLRHVGVAVQLEQHMPPIVVVPHACVLHGTIGSAMLWKGRAAQRMRCALPVWLLFAMTHPPLAGTTTDWSTTWFSMGGWVVNHVFAGAGRPDASRVFVPPSSLHALLPFLCLQHVLRGRRVVHFIDSTAALACVVRGFSRKPDLACLAGRLWFEACDLMIDYTAQYVPTNLNLADGPSRNDESLMEALGAVELLSWQFPDFSTGLGNWMAAIDQVSRLVA